MKRAATWGGLLVSGVFVWLAVRNVDFAQAWRALHEASYWPLIPALVALAIATAVRALRWQQLFEAGRRPPIGPITNAMLIGLLFNSILPARAGEAARVVALWREARVSRVESLATALAERVYDVFALLVLLFVAVPFLPDVSWLGKAAAVAAVLAAGIAGTVVVLLRWRERPVVWVLRKVTTEERAERMAHSVVQGLASFRHPATALRAFVLTVVSWLLIAASSWLLLQGFDFGVGFGAGLLVTISTTLVLVIPAAPGGVGAFETAAIVALSAYGVNRSSALSFGIVLHAVNLVPYLVAGYVAMQRHAVVVRRLRLQEAEAEAPNSG
jgi:glycosyltransferase 2 family protein